MFNLSVPTNAQVVHGAERVLLVFVTITLGYWVKAPSPFTKAAIVGAVFAGAAAVYQTVLSIVTNQ